MNETHPIGRREGQVPLPEGLSPEEQLRRVEKVVSEVDSQVRAAL